MNHTYTFINSSSPKGSIVAKPQPLAWLAILSLVLFTLVCIFGGAAGILRTGYVVLSFIVGAFLYIKYPALYVGFTWWLWFVTPFIARVVDYKSVWDPSRFMLVSQYIVTLLTFHTLLKELPKSLRQGGLPFVLAFIGVFYGCLIGIIKTSPFTAARGLLDWLTPVTFGFYLFINWRDYPLYRRTLERTFTWGVLITGIYGVVQFLNPPDWDLFWLLNTKLTSMGDPEPLKLRVWSTMASPAPYAAMMMAGLILLFSNKQLIRIPASAVGYLAFLLTTVRTLWGGWLIAFFTFITSLKAHLQMRLFITILIMALCTVPLTQIEQFSDTITTRFQTFSNLEDDDSARIRQKIYEQGLHSALTNGLGNGVGNTFIVNEKGVLEPIIIDSGILDIFFTLGWFGAIFYLLGILMVFTQAFQYLEYSFDSFMAASRAISLGMLSTLLGNSGMLGMSGMILWGFIAIAMAGHKYHVHQRMSK
ncbi:hypothetical protein NOS3756_39210 [Nostoc sp. NIES-3756]|uniref:O-antigen ligase family protein n=1 Tax=Nostoc sp. NIES-3756 TaxID=1751286 RepID=UPI00071FECD4|nr:hypothetical protein NOS3756_39210 [Nostoc sp. NIES-3756]BAY37291.1 hypothetical protein NIES2111_16280 [Nostoc sp. NIES-2111]